MSRHLDNLKRVCNKLQRKLGKDDPLFLQVKRELASREALASTASQYQDCTIPYCSFIKGDHAATGIRS